MHCGVGLFVKRVEPAVDTSEQRRINAPSEPQQTELELSHETDDDDVFTIHIPKASDLDDLYFVRDNMEALSACIEGFAGALRTF